MPNKPTLSVKAERVICPKCGKPGYLVVKKSDPTRSALYCECNPAGPTLETDTKPAEKNKEMEE